MQCLLLRQTIYKKCEHMAILYTHVDQDITHRLILFLEITNSLTDELRNLLKLSKLLPFSRSLQILTVYGICFRFYLLAVILRLENQSTPAADCLAINSSFIAVRIVLSDTDSEDFRDVTKTMCVCLWLPAENLANFTIIHSFYALQPCFVVITNFFGIEFMRVKLEDASTE